MDTCFFHHDVDDVPTGKTSVPVPVWCVHAPTPASVPPHEVLSTVPCSAAAGCWHACMHGCARALLRGRGGPLLAGTGTACSGVRGCAVLAAGTAGQGGGRWVGAGV